MASSTEAKTSGCRPIRSATWRRPAGAISGAKSTQINAAAPIGMPSRGGETDAPSERMAHQHRSGPAEVIEQRNDVGAERFELIVAGRTPGRLAKAAHVDGANLTVDGDDRGRSDPIIGKIRQPVDDQDRRPARPPKPPIENLGVSGPDPAGLMVLRAHPPN